eukprot:g10458.t1
MDQVDQVDVTALAFAQWISELKARTNSTQQQMLGEMGIIRNGVSSQCAEFSDFKRNSTNVSQQQQQQLSDMRERLQEAYNEIASLKKAKAQTMRGYAFSFPSFSIFRGTDQEIAADYQSLVEQLNIRQVESDTLKKQYSATTQQLQQQIVQLQTELNEADFCPRNTDYQLRMQREETHRMATGANENFMRTCAELELTTSYILFHRSNATELRKTRTDHDQAIANLADNMNRWNDTIRDLSREFHEFQKLMTGNQQRLQQQITEVVLIILSLINSDG